MIAIQIPKLYELFLDSQGICTDTRNIKKDGLFLALKGSNFNGNEFAQKALDQGAKYAIVDEATRANGHNIFLVENGLKALQDLATYHRDHFDIPIIAITGSNGKTTTKELTAKVLSQTYTCHFTQGNFNNHIGVPLTLLEMKASAEVAIIEMGANHVKEIDALCRIAKPTHGLITNIGKAHLEGFGGQEGVKKGKSELYKYLAEYNGVAFINKDEKFLAELSSLLDHRRVFYGNFETDEKESWLRVQKLNDSDEGMKVGFWNMHGEELIVKTKLIGEYNIPNLATAICLGLYFKVDEKKIVKALEAYVSKNNRSQITSFKGGKIILDAYNANPSSVLLALENFRKTDGKNKVVILGAMKELGSYSVEEHLKVAAVVQESKFEFTFLVGEEFKAAAKQFGFSFFPNVEELKNTLKDDFFKGKIILVKGSRSTTLEKLIQ